MQAPSLQATAALFTTKAKPKLEHFEFGDFDRGSVIHADTQATRQAIQALVNSFAGLKVLHLDTSSWMAPGPQAIIRHAKTLVSLSIDSKSPRSFCSWNDLTTILHACHELQELGTSLGDESHDLEDWLKYSKEYMARETRPGWAPNAIARLLVSICRANNVSGLSILMLVNRKLLAHAGMINSESCACSTSVT
jgi:hypothetical protein